MRKLISLLVLLQAVCTLGAQVKLTPEVGVSMLKTGYDNASVGVSPRVGVGLDYFFNQNENNWAVSSGLYFYQKKQMSSASLLHTTDNGIYPLDKYASADFFQNGKADHYQFIQDKSHREYLQLPVMAKYKYDIDEHYAVALSVGGYAAYRIGSGGTYKETTFRPGESKPSYTEKEEGGSFPSDTRWEAGFSTKVSLYAHKMVVNCVYDLNLLHWDTNKNQHLISLGVGYCF